MPKQANKTICADHASTNGLTKNRGGIMYLSIVNWKGKPYISLGKLTIVEIARAPILTRCMGSKIERLQILILDKWLRQISARLAYKATFTAATKPTEAGQ
jgi:hypothetical protein